MPKTGPIDCAAANNSVFKICLKSPTLKRKRVVAKSEDDDSGQNVVLVHSLTWTSESRRRESLKESGKRTMENKISVFKICLKSPSLTRKADTESPTVKESRRYINLANTI